MQIKNLKGPELTDVVNRLGKDGNWHKLDECIHQVSVNKKSNLCGALISGDTGTGKTFFIESYLKQVENSHPVLTARHHRQHEGIPYFGFKYGISDYLSKIYKQFGRTKFQDFSGSLKDQLGDSFPLFLDYIPELSLLAGKDPSFSQGSVPKVENQLYPLFKILFNFLADYYKKPLLFFTDDLQWIDGPGINLLKYLLLHLSPEKLIWIGACRIPQEKTSAISQLVEALSFEKRMIENIYLNGLNPEQTRKFIEITLGHSCHDQLTEVCFKLSAGNPSHLQVLLESLKDSDLIWLSKEVWHCDKKSISAKYKGQNTQLILLERIKKISGPSREMLSIIACMGRFSRRTLVDWLKGDDLLLAKLLKETNAAGLLEQGQNNIRFSEMHIGEMIYNRLPELRRSELHYKIAKLLYSRGIEQLNGTQIIFMTYHFNQSLDCVRANGEIQICAALNYKAGYFSKKDNAYDRANHFFKISGDLLRECTWEKVLEQVFLVYMERARIEYTLGEYDLAEIHLDYLLDRFHHTFKRVKVFELKITINNHLGRYRKVIQILKESLRELGLELPLDELALGEEVIFLKSLLSRQEKGEIPSEYSTDEAIREAILKLLYVGGMGLHHTSDVLMTWAALQIIIRSGADTSSGVKAIGYVSYARMLIISGDIQKGMDFGAKGLEINNVLKDFKLRCRVYGVYAFYIQPWKKAFEDSMPLLEEGIISGRKTGDLIGIYILKTHQLNLHFISGLPLKELLHYDFEESYPGMELTYYITHYQKSLIKFLMGETAVFSIPRQQPSWLAARLTIQEEKFYRNYVWARYYFLFGHYELAERAARESNDNRKLQDGSPLVPANLVTWFLSITQNWPNFSNDATKALAIQMKEILNSIEFWRQNAPVNYESSYWLLNAEWHKIKSEENRALECYQKSLETSGTNIYQRALTNELLAKHLLTLPEGRNSACNYLIEAINVYTEWGAVAKSRQLIQQYQSLITSAYPHSQEMDIETIQRELSEDMEVSSLIKKLMVLLLRVSGSTRVVVELMETTGVLSCYGDLSLINRVRKAKANNHLEAERTGIPHAMILMSHRAQNAVVVNDLSLDNGSREVETLQKRGVKSFLLLPVTINGHLSMVIYLENVFKKNWYLQERLKWVRITANQGAVIIENARTHEKTVKLNEEIRKEMNEKERLALLIEAQKDSHLKDLVQTQDNERERIASDLHDSLGSLLSSVKLRFNGLQEEIGSKIPEKIVPYNAAVTLLDDAIQELRRIAHNMSPVSLKRFGLRAAIQTFIEQINSSEQLDVDLQILGLERRLPEQVEIAAYRIGQELVQNVIKHAKATSMRIQVIGHKDSLNIIVEDNGIGVEKCKIAPGFGFTTIQSKIRMFKGNFTIESQPGKGTMVLVDIPVSQY